MISGFSASSEECGQQHEHVIFNSYAVLAPFDSGGTFSLKRID